MQDPGLIDQLRRSGPAAQITGRAPAVIAWVVVLVVALLASRTAVARASSQTARLQGAVSVQVGPLRAADGFRLFLQEQDCAGPDAAFSLTFVTARGGARLSHIFSGPRASCQIERHPDRVVLTLRLVHRLNIRLEIVPVAGHTGPRAAPVGCAQGMTRTLAATAVGHVGVALDAARLGHVDAAQVSAEFFTGAPLRCPAPAPSTGREFTAVVGTSVLDGDAARGHPAQLLITDTAPPLTPPGFRSSVTLELSGAAAMAPAPSGGTQIGTSTPFSQGSLTLAPLPACPGARAANGTLTGIITLEDPVLGPSTIDGAEATQAFSGPEGAVPGRCNGPGSIPLSADLVSSCDKADSGCSVAAGENVATLFDETSAGTQSIVSERVDFGDGSAPVSIGHLGAVRHAYADAGVYAATITVRDAAGVSSVATASVVIDR